MDDGNPLGSTEEEISWEVDVSPYLEQRRAAVRAHASQGDTAWMRSMPDDEFAIMFGAEYYIEPGPADESWPIERRLAVPAAAGLSRRSRTRLPEAVGAVA